MSNQFAIARHDGRSNARVIIDLVKNEQPGVVFTYAALGAALAAGTDREYSREAVCGAVNSALPALLKEEQRVLNNVRGIGYRLAYARDHNRLALDRKRRADVQLKRGLQILSNVRFEEMNENERLAHEGTLLVLSAVFAQQRALEGRQRKMEGAITRLVERVSAVEQG